MNTQAVKPVLITGGTGGLGPAVVQRLLPEYRCLVTYRSEREWAALQRDIGANERLHGMPVDLVDAAALAQLAADIRNQHGPVYGVVQLAGRFSGGSVEETTPDDWHDLFNRNLNSTFLVLRTFLPQIKERGAGRIIATSSAAMLNRPAGLAAYNVSKAGVGVLIESLAHELKNSRITANALLPGSMATPTMLQQMSREKLVPLEYVANVIAFLLSDAGAGITGALIPVTVTGEA